MNLREGLLKDLLDCLFFEPVNVFFGVLGLIFFLLIFGVPTWYIVLCVPVSTIAYASIIVDEEQSKRVFRESWVE